MSEEEAGGWGRLVVVSIILAVVVLTLVFLLVPGLGINLGSHPTTFPFTTATGARTTSVSTSPGGTPSTGQIIRLTVQALPGGGAETIEYTGLTAAYLSLTARADGVSPINYQWTFGDGTNSSAAVVQHSFAVNRAYDIHLKTTDATGAVESKDIILQAFSSQNSAASSVIFPQQATAGISPIGIEGGYAPKGTPLRVLVDGTQVATSVVNQDGYWLVNIGKLLPPKTNGSSYSIVVAPLNKTKNFVTLEGVSVSPAAGVPGNSIQVTGRSYAPFSTVSVFIGGVGVGQVQTDGLGSFQGNFTVPGASPLTQVGSYQLTTSPPAQGAQATFVVTRSTSLLSPSGLGIIPWIVVVAAVVAVVAFLLIRRRRRYYYLPPPAPSEGTAPPPTEGEAPPPESGEPPAEEPPEKTEAEPSEGETSEEPS